MTKFEIEVEIDDDSAAYEVRRVFEAVTKQLLDLAPTMRPSEARVLDDGDGLVIGRIKLRETSPSWA